MTASVQISACPACAAAPLAREIAGKSALQGDVVLSIPSLHCAACIGAVERRLMAVPGVRAARVNLSRKRVSIDGVALDAPMMIEALQQVGYEAQELDASMMASVETDAAGRALLVRLAVAGFAMMNVMLFSVAVWSGASEATRLMFHWISAAIAVPTLAFSGQVFFGSAWRALKVWRLNMDVPISLAIILAALMSLYETVLGGEQVYFDAALSLTFFLLVGRYLDHRTRIAARSAAQELSALEIPRAQRLVDGRLETVDVADLLVGDQISVLTGMRVPVDGVVVEGSAEVDRALLTGESRPIPVGVGATVSAGEVNLTAPLTLRVTAVGEDTTLRRMAALVEVAENARNKYTALADRAAQIYAPLVHILALLAFIGWITYDGDFNHALNVAIAVLIITCPCALGLAVPAVMTAASGNLFRRGLLVKTGTALERLAEVDTVVFDKTGTLTEGQARLDLSVMPAEELAVLMALAQASNHPVSRAILQAVPDGISPATLNDVTEHPGLGISATWNGSNVRLGKGEWLGAPSSPALAIGEKSARTLDFAETLRDGARDAVQGFASRGLPVLVLSGDGAEAVEKVSNALEADEAHADMSPQEKQAMIERLAREGRKVLMVGDGLNDTAALAQAHASISPASALDASRAASDIVLLGLSLSGLPDAFDVAVSARARVKENFGIAASYNMIAVPVALAGFATPLAAAIAMSASSITVLLNALRVR